MRPSLVLFSIAVHGAAVAAALGIGAYTAQRVLPPARVELDSREPAIAVPPQVVPRPDVAAEQPVDEQPLREVPTTEPSEPEPEPRPVERPMSPVVSPSEVLERAASFERWLQPTKDAPDEPPPEEPQEQPPKQPVAETTAAFVAARRTDNAPPPYPEREWRLGREGEVGLLVSVAADGTVTDVELQKPASSAAFNRAALRAARTWRFEPANERGRPVASRVPMVVEFRLTDRR